LEIILEVLLAKKILIAYASKSGTTRDIAQAIGKSLTDKGADASIQPVKSVASLDGIAAVVIGSGIRMGRWLPEAEDFVRKNETRLKQMPTAFFTVHLLHLDDGETSRAQRQAYTQAVRQILTPKTEVFFSGRLEFARLTIFERWISKAMKAQEQDLRDWNKIRTWAQGLCPTLELT
jgi:menaquinone-dependent protoporphyrinogen oxidase